MQLTRRSTACKGSSHARHHVSHVPVTRLTCNSALSTEVKLQENHEATVTEAAHGCPVLRQLQPLPPPTMGALESLYLVYTNPRKYFDKMWADREVTKGLFARLMPAVYVGSMSTLKDALAHESTGALSVGWPQSTIELIGKEGITNVTDPARHRRFRQLLGPAFSPDSIDAYLPDLQRIITQTLNKWVSKCEKGETVLAAPQLKQMTFQVISYVAMDLKLNDEELREASTEFQVWVKNLFTSAPIDKWPFPFHESMEARRRLLKRIGQRVADVRAQLDSGEPSLQLKKRSQPSVMVRMLQARDEDGNGLTDPQILDNLLNLLFAGHDTTSVQLMYLMFELSSRPDVLNRVRIEQAQIISRHGPDMTPAALKDMKYTGAVLQEILRYKIIVGDGARKAVEDIDVGGYIIPKGSFVDFNYRHMMENDPRWPNTTDPEKDPFHPSLLNPDRFMTEEGRQQGSQVPFGAGARTCLGMALAQAEAKVFLAVLARGYKYVADTNTGMKFTPFAVYKNDLPIFIEKL